MRYVISIILIGVIATAVLLWRPDPPSAPLSVPVVPVQTSTTSVPDLKSETPAQPVASQCADAASRTFANAGGEEHTERYTLSAGDTVTLCFRASGANADYLEAFFIQNGTRGGSIDFLHEGDTAMRIRVRHADGLTNIATSLSQNQWYQVEFRKSDFIVRWRPEGGNWSAPESFSHIGSGAISAFELVYGNSGNGDGRYSFGALP